MQRQSALTLKERVADIEHYYGMRISASTLCKYYKACKIKYGRVDLASINKLRQANILRREQRIFVEKIHLLEQTKAVYYMDETSDV